MQRLCFAFLILVTMPCLSTSSDAKSIPDGKTHPFDIKRIHLICSDHFDAGFRDTSGDSVGYTTEILNTYFNRHFPEILSNIAALNRTYVYTTHAWLVYLFLHCEELNSSFPAMTDLAKIQCPSSSLVENVTLAIKSGNLTWHAFPFNSLIEMMSPTMVSLATQFVHALDDEFGLKRKSVLSQRDVPGITAGVIGTLLQNGIQAITVGVNEMSAAPDVPKAFLWRSPTDPTQEIIALWNPKGYGWYDTDNCVMIDDWDTALCFYWRWDNSGPGSVSEFANVIEDLKSQIFFPNATVMVSTLDDYIMELQQHKYKLPVVTAEIGDTWAHGVATDPLKLKLWREISRNIEKLVESNQWNMSDPTTLHFLAMFLKTCEHSWGLDTKYFLSDTTNWNNQDFEFAKKNYSFLYVNYENMKNSWLEQRQFIYNALRLMPQLNPNFDDPRKLPLGIPLSSSVWKNSEQLSCKYWNITFGPNGEISYLLSKTKNKVWFDTRYNNIIQFVHTTYTDTDIDDYVINYGKCGSLCPMWFINDFGKDGLRNAQTIHNTWTPRTLQVIQVAPCVFSLKASMVNPKNIYGPPNTIYITTNLTLPNMVQFKLNWFNKTATRLPESLWFSMRPITTDTKAYWTVDKVDQKIPINSVVVNGSQHLHGHWHGVQYSGLDGNFELNALDSGIVSIGIQSPFPIPMDTPQDPTKGIHFLLWNNIWATNFPLWYPFQNQDINSDFRFQFVDNS